MVAVRRALPRRVPRRTRRIRTTVAAAVLVLVIAGCGGGTTSGVDHTFVVPAGTGAVLDSGGTVDILPRDLEVRVGDRLVVVNDDDRAHEVGPFTVAATKTFRFRFSEVGRFDSRCTLHKGGGRFFIDVLPKAHTGASS